MQSPSRDELLERLLECDVVVYNISENTTQQQVEEATWALTGKGMRSTYNIVFRGAKRNSGDLIDVVFK